MSPTTLWSAIVVSADLDNAMANPAKFWMQATEMWQKN
jgi:hypothetical protein